MIFSKPLGSGLYPLRPRVFVSYHHRGDQAYYNAFCQVFDNIYDLVYDNSLDRCVDSDDSEYTMRRIRENYIKGSSCTFVLVGAGTHGRKYVDWEIKATLDCQHGLIGVQLPTAATASGVLIPQRLHDNLTSRFAIWTSWDRIVNNPATVPDLVADARSRSPTLIMNSRQLKFRNDSGW